MEKMKEFSLVALVGFKGKSLKILVSRFPHMGKWVFLSFSLNKLKLYFQSIQIERFIKCNVFGHFTVPFSSGDQLHIK